MKKSFFIICFLLCVLFGFSQTLLNEVLTVLPKDVYIGDIIEIRYSFTTNINLTDDLSLNIQLPENPNYDILSATLSGTNGNYLLSLSCIPWKVGSLDIPKIDLSEYSETLSTSFAIDIPSISVQSIIERTQKKELRPIVAPILIPGTTWIVYLLIFFGIIVLGVVIFILVNTKKVISLWNDFTKKRVSKKNLKKTIRRIKKLNKHSAQLDNNTFAKELSLITRQFLSTRFKYNFNSVVSSRIYFELNTIFQDMLPESIVEKIDSISNILSRCDYIRFSGKENEKSEFSFVERSNLSETLIENFTYIANERSIEC